AASCTSVLGISGDFQEAASTGSGGGAASSSHHSSGANAQGGSNPHGSSSSQAPVTSSSTHHTTSVGVGGMGGGGGSTSQGIGGAGGTGGGAGGGGPGGICDSGSTTTIADCDSCLSMSCCGRFDDCIQDTTCNDCLMMGGAQGCDPSMKLDAFLGCEGTTCGDVCPLPICDSGIEIFGYACDMCMSQGACCMAAINCAGDQACLDCLGDPSQPQCATDPAYTQINDCLYNTCSVPCGTADGGSGDGG
ncbi:MAG TPA: hypothetical protein VGM56_23515, partial [Byssovorax sp.]